MTPELRILSAFFIAFFVTFISLPSIYRVANLKNLFDIPDERKIHRGAVPRLGGVGIFAGILFTSLITVDFTAKANLAGVLAAIVVIFFVGLKDDILVIAPLTKILGQLTAAFVIVFFGKLEFTDLHGFFGIHHIPRYFGVPLTVFTILVIINALNLIDGIDGLASSLAIVEAGAFGVWFYLVGDYEFAILSAVLIGALLAFLPFNFSKRRKMFMGDSGSLIAGLILSVLVIEFNEKNLQIAGQKYFILPAPSVSFGVLIVPLFDVMRVMYIRFLTKKGIFHPDQNHIHHTLLKLGFSHKQIVLVLVMINLAFIGLVFYLSPYVTIRRMLLLIILLAMAVFYIPASAARSKK